MNFSNSIQHIPRSFDPAQGREVAEGFTDFSLEIQQLLQGVGGSSPYLKSLIEKEAVWLKAAFDHPETCLTQEFKQLSNVAADALAQALRQAKRRVALWTALCDLSGIWSLEMVTQKLTEFADLSVSLALRGVLAPQLERAKLPIAQDISNPDQLGMFVLAMGKMGAHELNYSSDIDLICLFDDGLFETQDFFQARSAFINATKKMTSLLNDLTADGYVFRTDLRLRPNPAVTPVCMGIEAAERYYESLGRTWERAAFIKARVAAGDAKVGAAFLNSMVPFVWRKHLDFTAIEDAHNMRLQIRHHKGLGGPITISGHDMKLGRGGIREIEFFTQTRQLIAGGRDADLRVLGTQQGLSALAEKGWIEPPVAEVLSDHYRAHRTVEHRLQMINDAQTHSLPTSEEGFERLAALMGGNRADIQKDIIRRLEEVHELTEGFFVGPATAVAPEKEDGFQEITSAWPSYPALRSKRAVTIFDRLRPEIIRRLRATENPHDALLAFDGFLAGLPAGVQLFALFEANPQLIDLLIDIVGTSAGLAQYLARNAQVFDAVIGGSFWNDWLGVDALSKDLCHELNALQDYERKLDAARRWGKEWHFRIGVHLLREITTAEQAAKQYAELAQAMVQGLWPEVIKQFSLKYGVPPGRGAVVVAMGSLGSEALHAASDLDLIVIYDADGIEMSQGPRALNARSYYARLTQALVTAMTAPMAEGRLYEVDMRLRPSGNQGPVATSLQAFKSYQKDEAWIWEHLALTRARVLAGPADLAADVERFRCALMGRRDTDKMFGAVAKMRSRIAQARGAAQVWDLKSGSGHLQDIEMIAQLGHLAAGGGNRDVGAGLSACVETGLLDDAGRQDLARAYRLLFPLRVALKLLSRDAMGRDQIGIRAQKVLLRLTGKETMDELDAGIENVTTAAATTIEKMLPKPEEDADER